MAIFNMTYTNAELRPYLCFIARDTSSSVTLNKTGTPTEVSLEKSFDGITWSSYTIGDAISLPNVGNKVYLRNTSETPTGFSTGNNNRYTFSFAGKIEVSGDINYLLCKYSTTTVSDNCFYQLFLNCTGLVKALRLLLPATTIGQTCYVGMFNGCSNLVNGPLELPAENIPQQAYVGMFQFCFALKNAPRIKAKTVSGVINCSAMFGWCYELETLPELNIQSLLTVRCFENMFKYCTKIKLSTTQTGEYQTPYRIPASGTGTAQSLALSGMFDNTGGTFTGTPTINTTYYTSNTVV